MIHRFITAVLAALAMAAGAAAVEVNQASLAELESVKGIGPTLSAKISTARQQSQFKDWGDLLQRVSGLGPGNAARLSQAGLTVGGTAYAATAAASPPPARKASAAAPADAGARTPRKPAQP